MNIKKKERQIVVIISRIVTQVVSDLPTLMGGGWERGGR